MSDQKRSVDQRSLCRKRLAQLWEKRAMEEGLLHRAWQVAHKIAALLYEQFDDVQVVVFGSLTEPLGFTKRSDIDIAVSGLSPDMYEKARQKVMNTDSGFKIDIINFDTSKGRFRERIKQQAISIERGTPPVLWQTLYEHLQRQVFPTDAGDIYEMNRKRLTQRIADELTKIEGTLARIQRGLDSTDVFPVQVREFIENTIATDLVDVYNGIERIFERIAREVDMSVPTGSRWHKDLLAQMTEQRPERLPVISEAVFPRLGNLLDFRHQVNNIYGEELVYEQTEPHAMSIDALFASVSRDLKRFTDSLRSPEEDV